MRARLTIDLNAVADNWRALDAKTNVETAAVVKADAYGLGAARVGPALAKAGVQSFFVALAEEGVVLREAVGPSPRIFVFAGLMPGDEGMIRYADLIPLLNSASQVEAARKMATTHGELTPVGFQLDSGMNRLGMEADEVSSVLDAGLDGLNLKLVMSHLACADEPAHPQNEQQLQAFEAITQHPALANAPCSLAATGGVLLGTDYHFDLTRPGIGLYGGAPFTDAKPVISVSAPIIQIRDVEPHETVGYGGLFQASEKRRIATISMGYADGFIRSASAGFTAWLGDSPLPSAGRVSMDLITLDVTECPAAREGVMVDVIGARTSVDDLGDAAGTIGYEFLTSLGARYERVYIGG